MAIVQVEQRDMQRLHYMTAYAETNKVALYFKDEELYRII